MNAWYDAYVVSNADLRGGPSIRNPGSVSWSMRLASNFRKKVYVYVRPYFSWGENKASNEMTLRGGLTYRPFDALRLSVDPSFYQARYDLQYVTTLNFNNSDLYMVGTINQRTYRMSIRVNYSITPNISIEFWGQPFMAVGEYSAFKEVTNSTSENYNERFRYMNNEVRIPTESEVLEFEARTGDSVPDNAYGIFKTTSTSMDTYMEDPDFNIVNFRSNLVFRWEYVPGSTLFVVWSSNSAQYDQLPDNSFDHLTDRLWNLETSNTFLIKYTYRFIL